MTDLTHRAFFGDREYDFLLTPPLVRELERQCGTGIMTIFRRVAGNEFKLDDLLEIVRLALIGAGTPAEIAAALVAAYTPSMPLMELHGLALPILNTFMFGKVASDDE